MKIRFKLLLSNLVIGLIAISISIFFVYELTIIQKLVNTDISNAIKNLSTESYLDSLSQFFRYYDEVLTQSARNYAFTGDKKWKDRYYSIAGDLDIKVKEAIARGGSAEKTFFDVINDSNAKLIILEEKSFALVESGNKKEAISLLDSKEYADLKVVYSGALADYLKSRGAEYKQALVVSTNTVQLAGTNISDSVSRIILIFILSILAGVIVVLLFAWYFSKVFSKPINELKSATDEIVKGNLGKRVQVATKDEFGELANSFNIMTDKLKESIQGVEQKVKERTEQLEKLNGFMVGRELKMSELKRKIIELEQKNKNENSK